MTDVPPRPRPARDHVELRARDWVAIVLAVAVASALNVITIAVLWTAVADRSVIDTGLSENATQIISGAFGGIIGVLGSYIGFRSGERRREQRDEDDETTVRPR